MNFKDAFGKLSNNQVALFESAIGDGLSWPKITNDPFVNYCVDLYTDSNFGDFDEELYKREIAAFAELK